MLSDLGVQLSDILKRTFSSIQQEKRPGFRRDQLNWLQWRNACGVNDTCLLRRYVNRIDELLGKPAVHVPAKSGSPELRLQTAEKALQTQSLDRQVLERRVGNGRLETVYADGMISWVSISGGSRGMTFPDGTESIIMFQNFQATDPIPLSPPQLGWGERIENSLLNILTTGLSESEVTEYKANFGSGDLYERVTNHLRAVAFFVTQ